MIRKMRKETSKRYKNRIPALCRVFRKIREKNNWSQRELASALGVSNGVISMYETGFAKPKISFLPRIEIVCRKSSMDIHKEIILIKRWILELRKKDKVAKIN